MFPQFLKTTLLAGVAAACLLGQKPDFYKDLKNGPVYANGYTFTIPCANITSGSLATAGAKTLTIRGIPYGVAGADANHYLRISGGTGTAETVLITGGTATSGATSGTLAFTTSNTHTGACTITSATAGITEAHKANPTATGIHIAAGTYALYAKSVFSIGLALIGAGDKATFFTLADPAMDVFVGTTWLNASGMNIASGSAWQTAGSVFTVPTPGAVQVQNVWTSYVYNVITATVISASDSWFTATVHHALYKPLTAAAGVIRVSNIYADGRYYNGGAGRLTTTATIVGAVVTRTAGSVFTLLRAGGLVRIAGAIYYIQSVDGSGQITLTIAPTPGVGVAVEADTELLAPALLQLEGIIGGATFTNLWFQASQLSVNITNYTSNPTNEILFDTCIFDQDTISIAAVAMTNNDLNPASSSNSMRFSNIYVNSSGYGFLAQYVNNFSLTGSYVHVYDVFPHIALNTVTNASISNNKLAQDPASTATALISISATSDNMAILNNTMTIVVSGAKAIATGASGITNLSVLGNKLTGGAGLFSSSLGANQVLARGNWSSQAKRTVLVTATDTLIIPVEDESTLMYIDSGGTSGTCATLSGGYNGRTIQIYLNTNITFTNTANILTTLVGTTGMYLTATYDSGLNKWLIK